jgi:transposase
VHDLRDIVNAILYVNRTGIPWEYPPHDFPPYKTVYDYYARWEADGTTRQVHDLLRDKTRRAHGRSAEPTAAVVDAQSVKTSANVAETSQGIDAGKKIKGRKRHHRRQAPARRPGRGTSQRHQGLGRRRSPEQHLQPRRPPGHRGRGGAAATDERVRAATEAVGDRADLRLADAAPPPGTGLRSPALAIPDDDPLGDG